MSSKTARKQLAENIRYLAEKQKLPINILADLAAVSRSQLYDVLACRKSPTLDWIYKLSIALKVDLVDLLKSD